MRFVLPKYTPGRCITDFACLIVVKAKSENEAIFPYSSYRHMSLASDMIFEEFL